MVENESSRKDVFLAVVFGISGLLAFGLSFSLLQSNGWPFLFGFCAFVCIGGIALAENKLGVGLVFLAI